MLLLATGLTQSKIVLGHENKLGFGQEICTKIADYAYMRASALVHQHEQHPPLQETLT